MPSFTIAPALLRRLTLHDLAPHCRADHVDKPLGCQMQRPGRRHVGCGSLKSCTEANMQRPTPNAPMCAVNRSYMLDTGTCCCGSQRGSQERRRAVKRQPAGERHRRGGAHGPRHCRHAWSPVAAQWPVSHWKPSDQIRSATFMGISSAHRSAAGRGTRRCSASKPLTHHGEALRPAAGATTRPHPIDTTTRPPQPLTNLRGVELLDVAQNLDVVVLHKIDGHTLHDGGLGQEHSRPE